ncbi:MAG TPA: IPT/TIG domain-containing protein [Longimicrobium sp.]|nr:IPT/TIG domain-containing protein [Longimicrobium sp.]
MSAPCPHRVRHAALRMLLAGLPVAAACGDGTGSQPAREMSKTPLPSGTLAVLSCTARVAAGDVVCEPAPAPAAHGNGRRDDLRVLGGQGTYVRLASSGVAYDAGAQVLSFDVTVQNLATLGFATADGLARHDQGVRVFFAGGPTVVEGTSQNPVTVLNHDGTAGYTAASQTYFQYGGKLGGVDQAHLGADGVLATGETSTSKTWRIGVENTVTRFTFTLYVATRMPPGAVASAAPRVTSISPATLVPGAEATLTGANFNAKAASNTVTIGGVAATVTGGGPTSLTVTVPCAASGPLPIQVTQGAMKGAAFTHPLQANVRTLAPGQSVIVTDPAQVECNELAAAGGPARYTVAVYNTSSSPDAAVAVQVSGDGSASPPPLTALRAPRVAEPASDPLVTPFTRAMGARHLQVMEAGRRQATRLRERFRDDPRMRASRAAAVTEPPVTRSFHVGDITSPDYCNVGFTVNATRVYLGGKIAIYEDDATPAAFKVASNPAMQEYYNRIGSQFDSHMYPLVRDHFGDPLARDAATDNNGVLVALFSPILNNQFAGLAAGFVSYCDQFPNAPGNATSNFGEYFYAYLPTTAGTGYYSGFTADQWYWTIRDVFIHETKHVASAAARVVNGAPFEAGWLEEGTARNAEELWARHATDLAPWKANTGYGSLAAPGSVFCAIRPLSATCLAANPRRPSLDMYTHFASLYTAIDSTNSTLLSPFGPTPYDNNSYFYATSWSLVRYASDRYGASDEGFLTALNQSSNTGTANLAARAGVSIDQLLGGWALALAADDYPGLAAPGADIRLDTWNLRAIYGGLAKDLPGSFRTYPARGASVAFGSLAPFEVSPLHGGGVFTFDLSGTQAAPQLVRLRGSSGAPLPSTVRVAIARVQ